MRKNRFTLIELLVVITIIAILASLLLPSLVNARKQAYLTLCTGNLRQLAMSTTSYTNDFEWFMTNNRWSSGSWDYLLGPYDGRGTLPVKTWRFEDVSDSVRLQVQRVSKIYLCPADDVPPPDSEPRRIRKTYAVNRYTPADVGIVTNGLIDYNRYTPTRNGMAVRKLSEVTQPEKTILMQDKAQQSNQINRDEDQGTVRWYTHNIMAGDLSFYLGVYCRHRNLFSNNSFVDGHVEFLSRDELIDSPTGTSVGSLFDAVK